KYKKDYSNVINLDHYDLLYLRNLISYKCPESVPKNAYFLDMFLIT
ncbi:5853_t:CDS:1, partial [Funneliformis mosseae]